MHRATQGYAEGIRRKDSQRLTDMDFADDTELLGESREERATEPHKSRRKLEIRSVERGICPIARSTMNETAIFPLPV